MTANDKLFKTISEEFENVEPENWSASDEIAYSLVRGAMGEETADKIKADIIEMRKRDKIDAADGDIEAHDDVDGVERDFEAEKDRRHAMEAHPSNYRHEDRTEDEDEDEDEEVVTRDTVYPSDVIIDVVWNSVSDHPHECGDDECLLDGLTFAEYQDLALDYLGKPLRMFSDALVLLQFNKRTGVELDIFYNEDSNMIIVLPRFLKELVDVDTLSAIKNNVLEHVENGTLRKFD